MAKKKENTQEPAKGFITIGFKSIVSGDMDFLRDDLDEDPDNPYLNWVLEKTTERNTLTFECPVKLVNELLEKNRPCNYISRWELEEFGKNVGEEAFVEPLLAKCDEIALEANAKAVQQDWALGRSWRDDGVEFEDDELDQWVALLRRNIDNRIAKGYMTLDEYKAYFDENDAFLGPRKKPQTEAEWEESYSKYLEDVVYEEYYPEMDNYEDKKKHMEGSGLKTWDEKNMWSLDECREWLYNLGDDSNYEWYVDSFWLEDEKGNRIEEQTQN